MEEKIENKESTSAEVNDERNIDNLLKKNEDKLKKLKELLEKESILEEKEDEIFLLRYLLSHPNDSQFKNIIEAIKFTIQYRKENQEWLKKAVDEGQKKNKKQKN